MKGWNAPNCKRKCIIRLVPLAPSHTGKSELCTRFARNCCLSPGWNLAPNQNWIKDLVIDSIQCQLSIIDPGELTDPYSLDQYIRVSNGFIILYSITSTSSFNEVRSTYAHIKELKDIICPRQPFACVIVGNKVDLETEREVTIEQGVSLATSLNLPFFETCALTGLQVDDVFSEVTRVALQLGLGVEPLAPAPSKCWTALVDPNTNRTYYYNQVTGKSQWDVPTQSAGAQACYPPWQPVLDTHTNRTYFYNTKTGESLWELPPRQEASDDDDEHELSNTTTTVSSYVPTSAASYIPPRTGSFIASRAPPTANSSNCKTKLITLIALGLYRSGKSDLCAQFVRKQCLPPVWDSGIGQGWIKYLVIDGIQCRLSIFDPGEPYDPDSLDQKIQLSDGFIILYSITSTSSFNEVRSTYAHIKELKDIICPRQPFACVIVGNKVDLETKREITVEQGVSLATSLNLPFFETCAKTGLQVDDVFSEVTRDALQLRLGVDLQADQAAPAPAPSKCYLIGECCSVDVGEQQCTGVETPSSKSGDGASGGCASIATNVEDQAARGSASLCSVTTTTTTGECCSYVPALAVSYRPPRTFVTESPTSQTTKRKTPFIRLLVLGEPGVGKSALCIRCVQNSFLAPTYDATMDECWRKDITVDGIPCQLFIYDPGTVPAGYESMNDEYIHVSEGFIILYSITDCASFSKVRSIYDRIHHIKHGTGHSFACVIVGNKVDLETEREVTVEQGVSLATSMNLPFFETCAKTGLQVGDVFSGIV
ncbi:Protein ras-2 [Pelomyxa schiedti]|nr:Protein ras-2 [Pelomyxa schiedti]